MALINPELRDWWSHKRLTSFKYIGPCWGGGGVSMQVISTAFSKDEFTWFSTIYGEYNDNLLLVAFEKSTANLFNKIPYDDQDGKRLFYGQVWKNEYKITDEIASLLGLTIDVTKGFEIKNKEKIQFYIFSHDNCFFEIEPISEVLMFQVVQAILQQHNYYLDQDIQWERIIPKILRIISSNKEVDIQSVPKRNCVWIPQIESNKKIFWKSFRKGTIIFHENKAVFRDNYFPVAAPENTR